MNNVADEKKGITVKIDAELHAEIREYIEQHEGMTMADFITLAVTDELHPKFQQKEEKSMENMRTLAFQVPEELFQRIKDYLQRNNLSQKQFVIGLIEAELDREQTEREEVTEEQEEALLEEDMEEMYEEETVEESDAVEGAEMDYDEEYEEEQYDEEELESEGLSMSM